MTWGFEESAFILLFLMAIGQVIAGRTRGVFSLQFVFGLLAVLIFSTGVIPSDTVKISKLPEFGIFAFTVLMVHTGTQIRWNGKVHFKTVLWPIGLTLGLSFAFSCALGWLLDFSFIDVFSHMAVFGNGAVAAIASNVIQRSGQMGAHAPWLYFMVQSFMGAALMALGVKGIKDPLQMGVESIKPEPKTQPVQRAYNGTVVLALLMGVALVNKWLVATWVPFHPSLSALALGFVFSKIKVLPEAPLNHAESMGILMIGLVSLLALTFAHTPLFVILESLATVLLFTLTALVALLLVTFLITKNNKDGFHRQLIYLSCLCVGFPFAVPLYKHLSQRYGKVPALIPMVIEYCKWGYVIVPVIVIGFLPLIMA